ncbi:hypothetical protein HZ326_0650 [Fusarium oxysporum f. sp. albedinis]|nr:hypothetical protein HZ326_0650 [Fusarium oxysporum f. sp. albedinis]
MSVTEAFSWLYRQKMLWILSARSRIIPRLRIVIRLAFTPSALLNLLDSQAWQRSVRRMFQRDLAFWCA